MRTFDEYFSGVKNLRTENGYRYTDQDLENHIEYFKSCWEQNISCYISLEMLWFETEEGKQNFK
jgi:hypothetical protein